MYIFYFFKTTWLFVKIQNSESGIRETVNQAAQTTNLFPYFTFFKW